MSQFLIFFKRVTMGRSKWKFMRAVQQNNVIDQAYRQPFSDEFVHAVSHALPFEGCTLMLRDDIMTAFYCADHLQPARAIC